MRNQQTDWAVILASLAACISALMAFLTWLLHRKTTKIIDEQNRPILILSDEKILIEPSIWWKINYQSDQKNTGKHPACKIKNYILPFIIETGITPTFRFLPFHVSEAQDLYPELSHKVSFSETFRNDKRERLLCLLITQYKDIWHNSCYKIHYWREFRLNCSEPYSVDEKTLMEMCHPLLCELRIIISSNQSLSPFLPLLKYFLEIDNIYSNRDNYTKCNKFGQQIKKIAKRLIWRV